jgi:hypothetical protein
VAARKIRSGDARRALEVEQTRGNVAQRIDAERIDFLRREIARQVEQHGFAGGAGRRRERPAHQAGLRCDFFPE